MFPSNYMEWYPPSASTELYHGYQVLHESIQSCVARLYSARVWLRETKIYTPLYHGYNCLYLHDSNVQWRRQKQSLKGFTWCSQLLYTTWIETTVRSTFIYCTAGHIEVSWLGLSSHSHSSHHVARHDNLGCLPFKSPFSFHLGCAQH